MYMTDCVYCTVVVGSRVDSHFMCTVQILQICTFYELSDFQNWCYYVQASSKPGHILCCNLLSVNYAVCTHLCINIFIEGSGYKMLPVHRGFLHLSVIEKFPLCNRDNNILQYVYNYDMRKLL